MSVVKQHQPITGYGISVHLKKPRESLQSICISLYRRGYLKYGETVKSHCSNEIVKTWMIGDNTNPLPDGYDFESWNEKKKRAKANRLLKMEDRDTLGVKPVPITPEDIQWMQFYRNKFNQRRRRYGLPPMKISRSEVISGIQT